MHGATAGEGPHPLQIEHELFGFAHLNGKVVVVQVHLAVVVVVQVASVQV
eukprot:COSAG04_NODE_6575_length_1301_cov_1.621464_4_plen_49_part_01